MDAEHVSSGDSVNSLGESRSEPSVSARVSPEFEQDSSARKRPRRDSGSKAIRALSTEPVLPSASTPSPADSKMDDSAAMSKLSINTKVAGTDSNGQTEAIPIADPGANAENDDQSLEASTATATTNGEAHLIEDLDLNSPEQEQSPVASTGSYVRIEAAEPEDIDGPMSSPDIEIIESDDDSSYFANLVASFPYSQGSAEEAARSIATYIQRNCNELEESVFAQLATWFNELVRSLSSHRSGCRPFIQQNVTLWIEIGNMFDRILTQAVLFTQPFVAGAIRLDISSLLDSYAALVRILVHSDLTTLKSLPSDSQSLAHRLPRLLSTENLQALSKTCERSQFVLGLTKSCLASPEQIRVAVARTFCNNRGLQDLFEVAMILSELVKVDKCFELPLVQSVDLTVTMVNTLCLDLSRNLPTWTASTLAKSLYDLFMNMDDCLLGTLAQYGKVLSSNARSYLVGRLCVILPIIPALDESIGNQLSKLIVKDFDEVSAVDPDALIALWKVKICKVYLTKGNMDLRVSGTEILSIELCEVYTLFQKKSKLYAAVNEFNPSIRYIAKSIIDAHILEAIFGVDSHDQIVKASTSICQYLTLTRDQSSKVLDPMWDVLVTGQGSRSKAAVANLLNNLIYEGRFLNTEDIYRLCKKTRTNPPATVSHDFLTVFEALFSNITNGSNSSSPGSPGYQQLLVEGLGLSVTLIQVAWKTSETDVARISRALSALAPKAALACREAIYAECLDAVRNASPNTDSILEALLAITERNPADFKTLVADMDIMSILVDDLQRFSEKLRSGDSVEDEALAFRSLRARVTLLIRIADSQPTALAGDSFASIWASLTEQDSLGGKGCIVVWKLLNNLANACKAGFSENVFLDRCITEGLSSVRPENFDNDFLEFLVKALRYVEMKKRYLGAPDAETMMNNVLELIWRVLCEAKDDQVHDQASEFLSSFYLERQISSAEEVAAKQEKAIGRCLSQMKSIFDAATVQSNPSDQEAFNSYGVNIGVRTFRRILTLLGKLVYYQTQERLGGFALNSNQQLTTPLSRQGRKVSIKYQVGKMPVQVLEVDELETRTQLVARLHRLTGYAHFQIFCGGSRLDLLERPMQTIGSFAKASKLKPNFMISPLKPQYLHWYLNLVVMQRVTTGFLETTIINHFDSLYSFMVRDDDFGEATYLLFNHFAPHEKAIQAIADGTVALGDLLSSGALFQCMYAIRCLRFRLTEQISKSKMCWDVLTHGIVTLGNFLINIANVEEVLESATGTLLISLAILTMDEYLNARNVSEILETLDTRKLMRQVLLVMNDAVTAFVKPILALQCYGLALDLSLQSSNAWDELRSYYDVVNLHHRLLLECGAPNLNRDVTDTVLLSLWKASDSLQVKKDELVHWFWGIVSQMIGDASRNTIRSGPFFELSVKLFELEYPRQGLRLTDKNRFIEYTQTWSSLIQHHEPAQSLAMTVPDPALHGLVSLNRDCLLRLSRLTKDLPVENLHVDLLSRLLFPPATSYSGKQHVPILGSRTREILYDLLRIICKTGQPLMEVVSEMHNVVDQNTIESCSEDTTEMLRSSAGYVGLINLSNTCYMNSLLTQLFMNVPFRKFMLSAPMDSTSMSQKLLYEIKTLFGFLQNSCARSFRPEQFINCMRTIEGTAIDPRLQMDAEEFSNCLFEQWEGQIRSLAARDTFRSFYNGRQITQTKSKECEHISQKEDSYSVIQCNVQGFANLEQSLAHFVKGEEMEGANKYRCEKCGGKLVDAVRRTCLHNIADSIMFHLMRFTYDIASGERTKLNDHFEFPLDIDMSPYTYDNIVNPDAPHEPDMFSLVGVLLHSGQAESGHYISYARVRPTPPGEPAKWVEFDDDLVSLFDISGMAERFYGGFTEEQEYGTYQQSKMYSAYMLFYQRTSTIFCDPSDAGTSLTAPLPNWLARSIESKNNEVFRNLCLLDYPHSDFIDNLLRDIKSEHDCDEDHELRKDIIRLGCRHLSQVFNKKRYTDDYESSIDALKEAIGECVSCNLFAIHNLTSDLTPDGFPVLYDLTVRSSHPLVRSSIRKFIVGALLQLRDSPEDYGIDIESEITDNNDCDGGAFSMILRVFNAMEVLPLGMADYSARWDDFFGMIYDIVRFGAHESAILISINLLERLLEILSATHWKFVPSMNDLPYFDKIAMAIKSPMREANNLIKTVYVLLQHIDLSAGSFRPSQQPLNSWRGGRMPLNGTEMSLLNFTTKNGRICWLANCLRYFDEDEEKAANKSESSNTQTRLFDVADFMEMIMQCNPPPTFIDNVTVTIREGLDSRLSKTALDNHLRAATELLKATGSPDVFDMVHATISKITRDTARHYLAFYAGACLAVSVQRRAWRTCGEWALPLLGTASPPPVRDEAQQLIIKYLVDEEVIRTDNEERRKWRVGVSRNFLQIGHRAAMEVCNEPRGLTSELSPLVTVLNAVGTYLSTAINAHPELKETEDENLIPSIQGKVDQIRTGILPSNTISEPPCISKSHSIPVGRLGKYVLTRDATPPEVEMMDLDTFTDQLITSSVTEEEMYLSEEGEIHDDDEGEIDSVLSETIDGIPLSDFESDTNGTSELVNCAAAMEDEDMHHDSAGSGMQLNPFSSDDSVYLSEDD